MTNDFLSDYKKKVHTTVRGPEATDDLIINTRNEDLNFYKKKLRSNGLSGDPTNKDVTLQYESFLNALNNSYNSEKIQFIEDDSNQTDGSDYMALIEEIKSEIGIDEKMIAMDFNSSPVQVGRTIDWLRTRFRYLILARDFNTKGYFSGHMRRANYLVRWTDDLGNVYEQWAVVTGPNEKSTDFTKNKSSNSIIDTGGNQIEMYFGKTEYTHFLKRYNRIIVKDSEEIDTANKIKVLPKAWRINVIDDISDKYIVKIALTENYIDQADITDADIYAITHNGLSLDYSFEVPFASNMQTGYELQKSNINLYKNGKLENVDPNNFNIYINGSLVNNLQPFNVAGDYFIKITANGYPSSVSYGATVTFSLSGATTIYELRGSDRIKAYKTYTYDAKQIYNGVHSGASGTWSFSDSSFISGYTKTTSSISLVAKDKLGSFNLVFTDTNGAHTKPITVISLLLQQ